MGGELVQILKTNQILDGRYRLIRVIGCGTFGTVWCAEHLALSSLVAVKVLETVSLVGEGSQRFLREAQAAAALRSPHVVQILDCGMDGETPYIVMELLEGESLEHRLERLGRLGVAETERLIRHIARAVERAHEAGIIHRDLKPGNVFIQANDGDEVAKVLDFGLAKRQNVTVERSIDGMTPAGVLIGTPNYMSPERVCGEQDLGARTDIWSLGVIAYECLLGRAPFDGETITDVLSAILDMDQPVPSKHGPVPDGFDEWFARACAPDPVHRYATAKQAAEALAVLCGVAGSTSSPLPDARASMNRVQPVGIGLLEAGPATAGASPSGEKNEGRQRLSARVSGRESSRGLAWAGLFAFAGVILCGLDVIRRSSYAQQLLESESDRVEASVTAPLAAREPDGPISVPMSVRASDGSISDSTDLGRNPGESSELEVEHDVVLTPEALKPSASVAHASAPEPSPKNARRPARSTAPRLHAKPSASECERPWYFDDRGKPRAKPACL
jgi:serine/threonine-protein kinase